MNIVKNYMNELYFFSVCISQVKVFWQITITNLTLPDIALKLTVCHQALVCWQEEVTLRRIL